MPATVHAHSGKEGTLPTKPHLYAGRVAGIKILSLAYANVQSSRSHERLGQGTTTLHMKTDDLEPHDYLKAAM